MKRYAAILAPVAFFCVVLPRNSFAQNDPRVGIWKLNLVKSKYTPGPPPAREMRSYSPQGKLVLVKVESIDVKGAATALQYAAGDDGKDYPMSGLAAGNAISQKRIDANHFQVDTKKDGKLIGTTTDEVSKDGKVMTRTTTLTAPGGQAIRNIAVYDKQ